MHRLGTALLAVACALAPAATHAKPKKPKKPDNSFLVHPDARAHYNRAGKFAETNDLRAAVAELDAAHAIEPHPELLFIRAELRLRLGECSAAVALYEAFLASHPSEAAQQQAREGIAACPAEAKPEPEPEPEPAPEPPPEPPAPPPRPWHRDPAGATLLAFGVAATLTAGALAVPAVLERHQADIAPSSAYDDHRRTSIALQWSAGAAGIVGAALIVGVALRYRQVKRRQAQLSGWFAPDSAGLVLRARF